MVVNFTSPGVRLYCNPTCLTECCVDLMASVLEGKESKDELESSQKVNTDDVVLPHSATLLSLAGQSERLS